MELIGISELFAASALFTAGAFFKPLFLVFRDWVAWWLVEHFILTEKLTKAIRQRELNRQNLHTKYSFNTSEKAVDGSLVFEIDGKEVPEAEYRNYRKNEQQCREAFYRQDDLIQKRLVFADKITRHFSQHPENPVAALCRAIEKSMADRSTTQHRVYLSGEPANAQAESRAISAALHSASKKPDSPQ